MWEDGPAAKTGMHHTGRPWVVAAKAESDAALGTASILSLSILPLDMVASVMLPVDAHRHRRRPFGAFRGCQHSPCGRSTGG